MKFSPQVFFGGSKFFILGLGGGLLFFFFNLFSEQSFSPAEIQKHPKKIQTWKIFS